MPLFHAPQGDLTRFIARDPYRAVSRIADRLGADAFRGKLMLGDTVFLTGHEKARLFYSDELMRQGAAPWFVKQTLFGRGGVQSLDGDEHHRRKALHLRLMTRDVPDQLADAFRDELARLADSRPGRIVVQDEMARILTRVACKWAGVPGSHPETHAGMLSDLFEHAAPIHMSFMRGVTARRKANAWAGDLIASARTGNLRPTRGSALDEIANYRTVDGVPLSREVGAVELLNVIRPVVAVSAFLTFTAHALATHERARAAAEDAPDTLVQEVRRTAPFFPMLAARTVRDIEIEGDPVAAGTRVVLDIYGTNRDARVWDDPFMFRPSRFQNREVGPYDLIPQGGGDHASGHRCPGEWITIALMRAFTDWTTRIDYKRPRQDLDLEMGTLPALPSSRMIWTDLRPA
ncbi:fatty-acid peroxygenase [Palleronia marisminoris]|uniref:Fatty-acid peroxygenase n=1 Tax=Palleronia marisminoris TaxID=315423 RepID=A0A1Y5R6L7_9RHOB|nr:cytochrome P450 [Palleronia marisminoris]SFG05456.1 fatty-acid peroxygenase [Palleronia marisminoris]SLN10399.1 Fatty-acid peroxygenase [Palleronia marisminoris]